MCTSWKLERVLVGATQRDLASRAKISVHRLRLIESGRTMPSLHEKTALIAAFSYFSVRSDSEGRVLMGAEEHMT